MRSTRARVRVTSARGLKCSSSPKRAGAAASTAARRLPRPRAPHTSRRYAAGRDGRRNREVPRPRRRLASAADAAFPPARRPARRTKHAAVSFGRGRLGGHLRHGEQLEDLLSLLDRRARADQLEHLLAAFHLADEDRADELVPQEEEALVAASVVL